MLGGCVVRLIDRAVLVELIDGSGMSERELARRCGLSHSTVNHLVTGRRDSCSAQTALGIEFALGAPPGSLFSPETESERVAVVEFRRPS